MTLEEKIICNFYLDDLDKTHSCNEYKILKELINSQNTEPDDVHVLPKTPYPLCIVKDRYGGAYSGASFLAFNKDASNVADLPINAGDLDCEIFWDNRDKEYPLEDYVIGKGNTPDEALWDLVKQLEDKEK